MFPQFRMEKVQAASYPIYVGSTGYNTIDQAISSASAGSTITLYQDVTRTTDAMISCAKSLTINGNGHKITGFGVSMTTSGTSLTLKDVVWDGGGTTTVKSYMFNLAKGTILNLQKGTTIQNFSVGKTANYAVIHIQGTLNMYDGALLKELTGLYGSIRLDAAGAVFNMYGGVIENGSSVNAAASSYHEGVVLYVAVGSTVNMYGGEIRNNSYGDYACPGVIYLHSNGKNTFNMTGGIITGNSASYGGAVYNSGSSNVISVSGSAQIYENNGSSLAPKYISNIYLRKEQLLTVGSAHMSENSTVGVYTEENITTSKDVKFATNASLSDAAHFMSDYASHAGILYCDGKKDFTAWGLEVKGNHTAHEANTLWLSTNTAHDHTWNYIKNQANELQVYCSSKGGSNLCGNNGIEHAAILKLDTEDEYYGTVYNKATLVNDLTSALGGYVSEIEYYKVDTLGSMTGGIVVDQPRKVGYYYGVVKTRVNNQEYSVADYFQITREPLGFDTEPLNNQADDEGDVVKIVSGNDATTDLKVILTSPQDTIKIYKIADCNWDNVAKEYDTPVWTDTVVDWIKESQYQGPAYSSIEKLQNVSSGVWKGFFADMLKNSGNLVSSEKLTELDIEAYERQYKYADNEDGKNSCYIENVPFGTYAIIGYNDNTPMSPVIVNVYPQMEGPAYNNFVKTVIVTTLKKAEVTLDKKINNKKVEIVEKDEMVSFSVEFNLPTLPMDRVTLPEGATGINDYTLNFYDEMSKSFTIDEDSVKIFYKATGSSEWVLFTNETANYRAFTTEAYNKTTKTKIEADQNNEYYKQIIYDDTLNPELKNKYYTTVSDTLYDFRKVEDVVDANGHPINRMTLNFHVGPLKAWYQRDDTPSKISDVRIEYNATVSEQFEVGSENNYNTAIVEYESNANGTSISTIEDTVKAYTYAIQIVKVDGETITLPDGTPNPDPKYLNLAYFNLYKEVDGFIDGVWNYNLEGQKLEDVTLEAYKHQHPDYYYYSEKQTEEEVDNLGNVTTGEEHILTRAFYLYRADIESVNSKDGVWVFGVRNGNYILCETDAPAGYKLMAEDILFTMNLLTEDEAELFMGGSYRAYVDVKGNYVDTGTYKLTVLNYKGLQLPSTGGTGTLLFTVCGIAIMLTVTVYMIAKKRRSN